MLNARIEDIQSNDFEEWEDFVSEQGIDPFDHYGWFHVRIGVGDDSGTNDFQVCVSTPNACGRAKQHGSTPGIVVDQFTADHVRAAIYDRVEAIVAHDWDQLVDHLRKFMRWEYEGMSGR